MISYQQFIADYPEFNSAAFPQSGFNYWLNFASIMLTGRWGSPAAQGDPLALYDIGCELFVAHHLVIEALNQKAVAVGGLPGISRGVISSESPGSVSISYDTNASLELDAGHWNLTTYGTRFVNTARMLGAAPMTVGPSGCAGPYNGPAWPGPCPLPGYFSS